MWMALINGRVTVNWYDIDRPSGKNMSWYRVQVFSTKVQSEYDLYLDCILGLIGSMLRNACGEEKPCFSKHIVHRMA